MREDEPFNTPSCEMAPPSNDSHILAVSFHSERKGLKIALICSTNVDPSGERRVFSLRNPFFMRDVLSMKDFSRDDLEVLFSTADKLNSMKYKERVALGEGRILGVMFFEPSTRTRLSFESSMASIGGTSIGFSEIHTTSIEKGESLADTVRVVEANSDVLVLRHSLEGSARFAAEISSKPVVSAGIGTEEHPTQAMLDLYTIQKEKKKIDGLHIGIVGDLKYGRTVSLPESTDLQNTTYRLI